MPLQTGVNVVIAYRKESAFGVLPANDASAKKLRRTSFGLGLKKDMAKSAEIVNDYQRRASRHTMRKVDGAVAGELSLGTYADFMGSILRKNFAAVAPLAALINVTASATAPQFVRAAGSWITDGLRVGMVTRHAGWTTTATANNAKNYTIIALTATQMTVAETVVAKASGDSIVVSIPGKVAYVPLTGHTNESYAFEEWAGDALQSFRYLGNKVGMMDINVPPNDKATVSFNFVGQDRVSPPPATQYFTNAVAAGTTQMQTGVSGAVFVNGVATNLMTAFQLQVNGNLDTVGVVGSAITPDVFVGAVEAGGSFSTLWNGPTFDGYFDNETEVPLIVRLVDSVLPAADFLSITMPAVKVSGGDIPDAEKALIQNFQFTTRLGDGTNGYEATTIMVQDSLA